MVLPCYCFAISLLRGPACRRNSPESLGRPSVATTTSCRTLSKWSGCNPRSSDRRTRQVVAPRSHGSRLTCAWPASSRFRLQVSWFVVWTLSSDSALEMCRTCPVMAAGGTLELMLCTYIYLLAKPFTYFQDKRSLSIVGAEAPLCLQHTLYATTRTRGASRLLRQ
jgi:hypothetical protein